MQKGHEAARNRRCALVVRLITTDRRRPIDDRLAVRDLGRLLKPGQRSRKHRQLAVDHPLADPIGSLSHMSPVLRPNILIYLHGRAFAIESVAAVALRPRDPVVPPDSTSQ